MLGFAKKKHPKRVSTPKGCCFYIVSARTVDAGSWNKMVPRRNFASLSEGRYKTLNPSEKRFWDALDFVCGPVMFGAMGATLTMEEK